MAEYQILLVDDNLDLCEVVKGFLEKNGLKVRVAHNGADAYDIIHETRPDLIVLDVEMPEIDGFQLARMLRKENSQTPVLFMSGRLDTSSVMQAFELGAEDYIKKPVDPVELLARIKCRLKDKAANTSGIYPIGSYTYNSQTLELTDHQGNLSQLTPLQGKILDFLYRNKSKTVTRNAIYEFAWDHQSSDSRAVDMHISNLRKLLSKDKNIEIRTDYSLGYSLFVR